MAEQRVALVTGAARGIGAATVDRLVADGLRAVAVDSCAGDDGPAGVRYPLATRDDLAALGDRHGDAVATVVADVRDPAALADAAALALDRFGRLDVAVAAAAVIVGGEPAWQTPDEDLATLLDVDVVGVWNTARATVPPMLDGPDPAGCRFIAIASAAGHRGLFRLAAYNVAKHAVVGLVRGLAADLVGTGVVAVAVSPGSTDTAMLRATADLYGLPDTSGFAASSGLGRLLEPREIAGVVAFCCTPEGAALNGTALDASGGFRPG